jgi:hypothetical protein
VIRDLAVLLRFVMTGVLPEGHPGHATRFCLDLPVPVLHSPVLEAAKEGLCILCRKRAGHWRHGQSGRTLRRLAKTGGIR